MDQEERGLDFGGFGSRARHVVVILGLVFAVTLAVVVGKQMTTEAMAVVIGIVCGVAAGIPSSLLLLVVLTRRERQQNEGARQHGQQGNYPPVVVIQGSGGAQGLPHGPQAGYWPAPMPGPAVDRQFHVLGGDDLRLDDGRF
jgi:hypothetical protein